jgi:hypothetical protein
MDPQLAEVHWHVHRRDRTDGPGRRATMHAREEIEAAIMLVAGGHFPRVLISNLVDCGGAVRNLRGVADAAGVDLELLPRTDGRGCDIAVTAR